MPLFLYQSYEFSFFNSSCSSHKKQNQHSRIDSVYPQPTFEKQKIKQHRNSLFFTLKSKIQVNILTHKKIAKTDHILLQKQHWSSLIRLLQSSYFCLFNLFKLSSYVFYTPSQPLQSLPVNYPQHKL